MRMGKNPDPAGTWFGYPVSGDDHKLVVQQSLSGFIVSARSSGKSTRMACCAPFGVIIWGAESVHRLDTGYFTPAA